MRILSYNCCALPVFTGDIGLRLELAAREIGRLDPDLIFLQEIFLTGHLARVRAGLAAWPHAAWQPLSFTRVAGGICVLSKRPIRDWAFTPFLAQGPLWRFSALARLSPKGFLWVELDELSAVHTHLVADYRAGSTDRGNPYHRLQEAQLGQIAARLRREGEARPMIVAGDLNTKPDSPVLARFLGEQRLLDSMEGVSAPSIIDEPYYRIPFCRAADRRLDYVLFRGLRGKASARYVLTDRVRLSARRHATLSDHAGVLAGLPSASRARSR